MAAGGSRVDYAFESILRDRLLSVQNLDQTLIPRIVLEGVKDFKDDVKRRFEDPSASYTIDLRARNLNDVSAMVEAGELTISGCVTLYVPYMKITDGFFQSRHRELFWSLRVQDRGSAEGASPL